MLMLSMLLLLVVVVVIVVGVVKSLKLYVVVESMHTHMKLGAHALLNVNHSYHVDFRSLCSSVDLRVYAPALILGVYTPALIGTICILHSQVVVVSLHCR